MGRSKVHLSLGYGTTANMVNGFNGNNIDILNAYYGLQSSYGLGLMVGKFDSPVGYETYNQMDNRQFTRSWGFALAPFLSTGVGIDYGQGDMWKVGLIISNGQGLDTNEGDRDQTISLVVDVDPIENLHVDLNYLTGTEGTEHSNDGKTFPTANVTVMDLSAAYMINEMFDVAFNYIDSSRTPDGGDAMKANSMAFYGDAHLGMFGVSLRYEMVTYDAGFMNYNGAYGDPDDENAANPGAFAASLFRTNAPTAFADKNSVSSITLTGKAEIDKNAMAVLEYRTDSSDEEAFVDADGEPATSQSTILVGLMYRF